MKMSDFIKNMGIILVGLLVIFLIYLNIAPNKVSSEYDEDERGQWELNESSEEAISLETTNEPDRLYLGKLTRDNETTYSQSTTVVDKKETSITNEQLMIPDNLAWRNILENLEDSYTPCELIKKAKAQKDFKGMHPIIEKLYQTYITKVSDGENTYRLYDATFVLERMQPNLSAEELDAINQLRTLIYYDLLNYDKGPLLPIVSQYIPESDPTVKDELLYYLDQTNTYQANPEINDIVNLSAVYFGFTPEAHLFEVRDKGNLISFSIVRDSRVATEGVCLDFNKDDYVFYSQQTGDANQTLLPVDLYFSFKEEYYIEVENLYLSLTNHLLKNEASYSKSEPYRAPDNQQEKLETTVPNESIHPTSNTEMPKDWYALSKRASQLSEEMWRNMIFGSEERNLIVEPIFIDEGIISGITHPGANVNIGWISLLEGMPMPENINLKADENGYFETKVEGLNSNIIAMITVSDSMGDLLCMLTDIYLYEYHPTAQEHSSGKLTVDNYYVGDNRVTGKAYPNAEIQIMNQGGGGSVGEVVTADTDGYFDIMVVPKVRKNSSFIITVTNPDNNEKITVIPLIRP